MTDERCDLCGRPMDWSAGSCQAQVNKTGESPGGDYIDCDGNPHKLDVRDYLRLKRDMPGIIETLESLVHDRNKTDPVHVYIAIQALAHQLRKDHIDEPIERKLVGR